MQERCGIEGLVARVISTDRDATLVVHPVVVGHDIIGRVPQWNLPRSYGEGQGLAMRDALATRIGVGRLDVHFVSSLPVMQRTACKAWVDTRPVQMAWAESSTMPAHDVVDDACD